MAKRSTGPWWYEGKNSFYVWHEGRKVSLKTAVKSQAVRAWHRLMGGVIPDPPQSTRTVSAPIPVPVAGPTVGDVVDAFLGAAAKRISPDAHRGYVKFLKPLATMFGGREIASLTPDDVDRFLARQTTWGATYRANFHGTASQFFKWAIGEGHVVKNVMVKVVKPRKASRGSSAVLTEVEHLSLLAHADPVTHDLLVILWATGARPSEVASITSGMVKASKDGVLVLEAHKTASKGKHRHLLLAGEAWAIVQRRAAEGEGFIFKGLNGKLTATAIGSRLRDLCKKAGIRHLVPYGYRHTFATDALAAGVPDATVAALLGHCDTSMIHKHYSHLSSRTRALKDAAAKIR